MYEVEPLKQGIARAKDSIKIFESAINKELGTIKEYEMMIEVLEKKKDDNSDRPNH